uniref:Transcriptional regulator n=1 Tax=Syphacia muris TaxID=451379 RepID=A0A0N5AT54_9BILA
MKTKQVRITWLSFVEAVVGRVSAVLAADSTYLLASDVKAKELSSMKRYIH